MNWCQPHWNQLRETINAKGLGKFVSQNGEEAFEALVDGEKFDPLIGCWARINMAMLNSPALNGRAMQCPLCILVEDGQPETVRNWLEGVTDDALKYAVDQGLIGRQ